MTNLKIFHITLVTLLFITACNAPNQQPAASAPEIEPSDNLQIVDESAEISEDLPTILDIAQRHGSFSTFAQLIEAADLEETLQNSLALTLLAPTDEAFAKLPESKLKGLLDPDHKEELQAILSNHILPEVYRSVDLLHGKQAPTLSGYSLQISNDHGLKLNNATVTTADIDASNGVVHIVDQVIFAGN